VAITFLVTKTGKAQEKYKFSKLYQICDLIMLSSIASITLINVEKIPLAFCCSGGVAININFIECPLPCDYCPWEANLDSRSAQKVNVETTYLVELITKYNPDLVMLHGGEPYKKNGVTDLLKELHRLRNTSIGMKINSVLIPKEKILLQQIAQYIDVALIEVVDIHNDEINYGELISFLNFLTENNKHVEIVYITTLRNAVDVFHKFVDALKNLLKTKTIPLNFVFANDFMELSKKLYIIDWLRKMGIIVQAPMEDVVEIASTSCISCQNPIIVRQGGHLFKLNIKSDKSCKYCGYKYNVFKFPKKIITLPLLLQLM